MMDYEVYLDRLYTMLAGIECPECHGDGCDACGEIGAMSESQYEKWRSEVSDDRKNYGTEFP